MGGLPGEADGHHSALNMGHPEGQGARLIPEATSPHRQAGPGEAGGSGNKR